MHARSAVLILLLVGTALPAGAVDHRPWSTVPDGPYAALTATPLEFIASDGVAISYAVHMPSVPPGTRVPIVLSVGPYFGLSEEPVETPSSSRLTGFLIDNLVSHGYAVVAASVRGTGLSGGCMELMSFREAQDIDELITFLASEPWSTGAIGMAGKSYDGGTTWMAAQFGNPALKTIIPIAGVTDAGDLLVHRGAAQFRTPVFHSVVYWPFGFEADPLAGFVGMDRAPEDRAANAACPEMAKGQAAGLYSTYTGDTKIAPVAADYWAERAWRDAALSNYEGSVFIVHGLRDWNVIPSQVAPFFNDINGTKKLLLGQWTHQYPDEGVFSQRNDFALLLKNWLDHELKALPANIGPVAEVADGLNGQWRSYSQWPPVPVATKRWNLSANASLVDGPATPFRAQIVSPAGTTTFSRPCHLGSSPTFFQARLSSGFRYSGIGTLDITLDPPTPGVLMASVCMNGTLIAHGAAHTLYPHDNDLELPTPGAPHTVRIDLEPVERTLPSSGRLSIAVRFEDFAQGAESGNGYWPGTSPGVGVVTGGQLSLPAS